MSVALFKCDEKIVLQFICAISGFFKPLFIFPYCCKGYIRSNGTFDPKCMEMRVPMTSDDVSSLTSSYEIFQCLDVSAAICMSMFIEYFISKLDLSSASCWLSEILLYAEIGSRISFRCLPYDKTTHSKKCSWIEKSFHCNKWTNKKTWRKVIKIEWF